MFTFQTFEMRMKLKRSVWADRMRVNGSWSQRRMLGGERGGRRTWARDGEERNERQCAGKTETFHKPCSDHFHLTCRVISLLMKSEPHTTDQTVWSDTKGRKAVKRETGSDENWNSYMLISVLWFCIWDWSLSDSDSSLVSSIILSSVCFSPPLHPPSILINISPDESLPHTLSPLMSLFSACSRPSYRMTSYFQVAAICGVDGHLWS